MADYSDNILPVFTSASPVDGVSITATPFVTGFEGWRMLASSGNGWYPNNSTSGNDRGVIIVDLGKPRRIGKYSFKSGSYFPKTWTVQGSDTGLFSGEHEVLSTVIDSQTAPSSVLTKEFYIDKPKSYRFYKFDITKSSSGTFLQILKLEMMEKLPENKILLSSGGKLSSYIPKESSGNLMIPQMSSNTSNGITLTSDQWTSRPAWQAFDRNSPIYLSNTPINTNAWIVIHMPNNKDTPYSYRITGLITGVNDLTLAPKDWNLYGGSDGVRWELLDSQAGVNWLANEEKEFKLKVNIPHQYYKIEITKTDDATGRKTLGEFNMITSKGVESYKVINKNDPNEKMFIDHGITTDLNLAKIFSKKTLVEFNTNTLGSGKTFEHIIDMSKRRVDKITLG